jgi:hypothetical protein
MLSQRYHDLSFIMNLPLGDGIELIYNAFEKNAEEKLYSRWLVDYGRMTDETFVSFEEYKNSFKNIKKPRKSIEEMIEQAEMIKKADMEGGEYSEII